MNKVTIDTEKIINMIVQNADNDQNNLGNNFGIVIINPQIHVEYHYPSPGTYYPKSEVVDPEDLINIDEIENEYSLDIISFRSDAVDIVKEETGKEYEFLDEEDWEKITEYINEWIGEWKQYARANKKESIELFDEEFKIEWV